MSQACCHQSFIRVFNNFNFKFDSRFYEDIRNFYFVFFVMGGLRSEYTP
jgi:hypothetical protein